MANPTTAIPGRSVQDVPGPAPGPRPDSPRPSRDPFPRDPLPVDPTTPAPHPSTTPHPQIVAGFVRAIQSLTGAIPAAWGDHEGAAMAFAVCVPRLTAVRLVVWCRENAMQLEVVAARVMSDTLATEPGLLELSPVEAAEEGAALLQSLWPKGAVMQRQPPPPPKPHTTPAHPVLIQLRDLGEKWHRLALLPANQAKQNAPTAWRAQIINGIAQEKAKGLAAGLAKSEMMEALESAGDRWVWEIPPPAREYSLDEFGEMPPTMDMTVKLPT